MRDLRVAIREGRHPRWHGRGPDRRLLAAASPGRSFTRERAALGRTTPTRRRCRWAPRSGHRLGTELPVARGGLPHHRQGARVGIEAKRSHREPGLRHKVADRHLHVQQVSPGGESRLSAGRNRPSRTRPECPRRSSFGACERAPDRRAGVTPTPPTRLCPVGDACREGREPKRRCPRSPSSAPPSGVLVPRRTPSRRWST